MTATTKTTDKLNKAGQAVACKDDLKDLLNSGNDMGVSTAGFRSNTFNPGESTEAMYARFRQVLSDLNNAENVNKTSREIIKKTDMHARQVQVHSTNQLQDRVNDLSLWKNELNGEIKSASLELDNMNEWKNRLEKAQFSFEIAKMISSDNMNAREQRDGVDKIQDSVELGLLKEFEIANSAIELIKRTIRQSELQISHSKEFKRDLEADWSDKMETNGIECINIKLKDDSTCKQFYPAAAKFQEIQSTPESWAQFTHDNLARAEQERMASLQLRALIDNILDTASYDLISQSDDVNSMFNQRISTLNESLWKLREDLKKVYNMICQCEKNIDELRQCMLRKEQTLKVAQTRLRNREDRPNVELSRDPAQYSLIAEVNDLMRSSDILIQKTNESENSLKDLLDERMVLEKNISVIDWSIFIEKDKCLPHRSRFPGKMKLSGL